MMQYLYLFYGYFVFFYSLSLIISYVMLIYFAQRNIQKQKRWTREYVRQVVEASPYTPGVSIVAPAYNEGVNIVDNVTSLLRQNYPKFEVIIVNDGSTDDTLEKLVEHFKLVEVPYDYVYHIHCQPIKRIFRSTDPQFDKLTVVDKINGGTKADSVNGGINVVKYPYFINTDADCILSRDAIFNCIFPILLDHEVIAVSGTMSMSNGFTFNEDNEIETYKASKNPLALFQDLEYKRSFLLGKLGWGYVNCMTNVSGGYGLFDTKVVLASGGYSFDSFAEDMDILYRMISYCCNFGRPYRVVQITQTCCWTEGPSTPRVLMRQRTRWGRGLIQLLHQHHDMILNPRYRKLGMITLPFVTSFEFLAPIIEIIGFCMMVYLTLTGGVNWGTFWIVFLMVYIFAVMLSIFVVLYDHMVGGSYTSSKSYWPLLLAAIVEPFTFHPFITFCSIRGYLKYIFNTKATWGTMTRKRYNKKGDNKPQKASGGGKGNSADNEPESLWQPESEGNVVTPAPAPSGNLHTEPAS